MMFSCQSIKSEMAPEKINENEKREKAAGNLIVAHKLSQFV